MFIAIALTTAFYIAGALLMISYMDLYKAHEEVPQFFETAAMDTAIIMLWPFFVFVSLFIRLLTTRKGE